jgi:hypothetical protein
MTNSIWDLSIPQSQCGKRSYCGRCVDCRKALGARGEALERPTDPWANERGVDKHCPLERS